jgi:3-methyladenine DNA glycosylase AlkC
VRRAVAFAIARNFQNLNDETRGILAILAEDESVYVRKGVANAVVENRRIKEFQIYREIFGKLNKDEKMRKYLEELASAYSS